MIPNGHGQQRAPARQAEVVRISDLVIYPAGYKATRDSRRLRLTLKEFRLLWLLARRSGEVVSRREIAEEAWDMHLQGNTNLVDVHVRRLRSKVDDPFEKKLIHTVRGLGYILDEDWAEPD